MEDAKELLSYIQALWLYAGILACFIALLSCVASLALNSMADHLMPPTSSGRKESTTETFSTTSTPTSTVLKRAWTEAHKEENEEGLQGEKRAKRPRVEEPMEVADLECLDDVHVYDSSQLKAHESLPLKSHGAARPRPSAHDQFAFLENFLENCHAQRKVSATGSKAASSESPSSESVSEKTARSKTASSDSAHEPAQSIFKSILKKGTICHEYCGNGANISLGTKKTVRFAAKKTVRFV